MDDEGYSIRPDEEDEPGDILGTVSNVISCKYQEFVREITLKVMFVEITEMKMLMFGSELI